MDPLRENIRNLRQDYDKDSLNEEDLSPNPVLQFENWLNLAFSKGVNEPIAMTIATVNDQCQPSSRIVLLRGFDDNGFIFYTNYNSRKAIEIKSHPFAALSFYWYDLDKQVRIEGTVAPIADHISDEYFNSRPRESQLGAWASAQSSIIASREEFEKKLEALNSQYAGQPVPRPPYWGGYCVTPSRFEFWQGRSNRLHDRFQYILKDKRWIIQRLAP